MPVSSTFADGGHVSPMTNQGGSQQWLVAHLSAALSIIDAIQGPKDAASYIQMALDVVTEQNNSPPKV